MENPKNFRNGRWMDYALGLCAAILFYLVISHFNVILIGIGKFNTFIRPVTIGIMIAYVMNPLVNIFRKYLYSKFLKSEAVTHSLSVLSAIVVVIFFIVMLLVALIPQLAESVITFISNLNGYIASLQRLLGQLSDSMASAGADTTQFDDVTTMLLSSISQMVPTDATSMVGTFTDIGVSIFDFVIGIIMAIYMMMDREHLVGEVQKLLKLILKDKKYNAVANFASRCNRILVRFIAGDLLDGMIVGVANFIFMQIAGLNYGILISVVVGVCNLAPTFGPFLGGAIGAIILVLVNPWHALWFIIFTIVVQIVDGYILKPRLFGSTLGISGLWILVCIVVGGKIFGVWGILLAIPFAAISDFIYHDNFLVFLQRRKNASQEREKKANEEAKEKASVPEQKD